MALANVYFKRLDGNFATSTGFTTDDAVSGLLFDISGQTGFWESEAGTKAASYLKDKVVELNNLQEANELGADSNDGASVLTALLNGVALYHIRKFFNVVGGTGRLFVAFADCSSSWDALLDMQRAASGLICQFGVWTEQYLWSVSDENADNYELNLVKDLNTVMESMADDYFAPAVCALSANTSKVKTASGTSDVVMSKIPVADVDSPYVALFVGQDDADSVREMQALFTSTVPVGCVGIAIGVMAVRNVNESVGWVQPGNVGSHVNGIEMGFGDATVDATTKRLAKSTAYSALTVEQLNILNDGRYNFLRGYEGIENAVYFSADWTCSTGDYNTVARNRTINKSRRLVRNALLPYVNSPVLVNPANGQLTAGQITQYMNTINDALAAMVGTEISGIGSVVVDGTQNVLQTHTLEFSYSLIPTGLANVMNVNESLVMQQ